jgi:hypothetical protein
MIPAAIVWLLQDLLQVLAMGFMLVPEFFLLVVAYMIVSEPLTYRRVSRWIWFAFAGGMLWDLRWAAVPGMSALINVMCVVFVYWIWDRTPLSGRSAFLFASLAGGVHFMSGIAHYLAWAVPSQAAIRMFIVQQLLTVPVLIALCAIYAFKAGGTHV